MFYKKYTFGGAEVHFVEVPVEAKKTTVGMAVYPKGVEFDPKKVCDALIQVAFTGDESLVSCARGMTMHGGSSSVLKITRQAQFMSGALNTYLSDDNGNEYVHKLSYDAGTDVFSVSVRYENRSKEARTLELLSSFSLNGISSPQNDFTARGLSLYRLTSSRKQVCRLRTDALSDLGFGTGTLGAAVEKWGEVGSMPNRGFYPFAAIEHPDGFFLGVQMEAPYSWQMELFGSGKTCTLSGGLADYETSHWRKTVRPGESFETHRAYFTVQKSLLGVCNALVKELNKRRSVPNSEGSLPVIFTGNCMSRGNLAPAKLNRLLKALKPLPIGYFVMDSGNLLPEGMAEAANKIKEAGLRPGIRLEYETVERGSETFEREELFLKRDGIPITAKGRRFLDLRRPEVKSSLDETILRYLKVNGLSYLRVDYSDSYGIGCESDSGAALGEGGRQVAEESIFFFDKLKELAPDFILENSSLGRLEPLRMSKSALCSLSECSGAEAPLIAANVSRVIPACEILIRADLQKEEPDERTIYSLCAAMLGRVCLSGEIHLCAPEKLELVRKGLEFYQGITDIIRRGEIRMIDCDVNDYCTPKGRQIFVKDFRQRRLVVVHFFESETAVRIPLGGYVLKEVFTDLHYGMRNEYLRIAGQPFHAGVFLLEKGEDV